MNQREVFQTKLAYVLSQGAREGLRLEAFWLELTPERQAILWCKSRTKEEVRRAVDKLKEEGAPFLSDILAKVGLVSGQPFPGRWETNDLPGQSWHQWGEAAAIRVISPAGKTIWSSGHPGYTHLAKLAQQVNLTSGLFWKNRDATHLQLRPDAVRAYYAWPEIDQVMKERHNVWNQRASEG